MPASGASATIASGASLPSSVLAKAKRSGPRRNRSRPGKTTTPTTRRRRVRPRLSATISRRSTNGSAPTPPPRPPRRQRRRCRVRGRGIRPGVAPAPTPGTTPARDADDRPPPRSPPPPVTVFTLPPPAAMPPAAARPATAATARDRHCDDRRPRRVLVAASRARDGSEAHIVVGDEPDGVIDWACAELERLEQCWSRFRLTASWLVNALRVVDRCHASMLPRASRARLIFTV